MTMMQTILVWVSIGLAVFFLTRKIIRQFGKKKQNDCGCGKCG